MFLLMGNPLPEVFREEIYETNETFKVEYGITMTTTSNIGTPKNYATIKELVGHIKSLFSSPSAKRFRNMNGCEITTLRQISTPGSKDVVCRLKKGLLEHEVTKLACLLTE